MKIEKNIVRFSSGNEKYAHTGIIGLSPDLKVSEGYDGPFYDPDMAIEDKEYFLAKEDQIELADYMIEQWNKFKDRVA